MENTPRSWAAALTCPDARPEPSRAPAVRLAEPAPRRVPIHLANRGVPGDWAPWNPVDFGYWRSIAAQRPWNLVAGCPWTDRSFWPVHIGHRGHGGCFYPLPPLPTARAPSDDARYPGHVMAGIRGSSRRDIPGKGIRGRTSRWR